MNATNYFQKEAQKIATPTTASVIITDTTSNKITATFYK